MALTAGDITYNASVTLVDESHVTWGAAELRGYLNEALRATVAVKPDALPIQAPVTLAVGVAQTIPADGVALIALKRNTVGTQRIITEVDGQLLDEVQRFWPAGTAERIVEHYTVNPANPRQFDVYPPNDGTGQVLMLYGALPTPIEEAADLIQVPDTYENALTQFVLSRAYAKNTKRQDLTKSAAAMQAWGQALGMKSQAQVAISPRVASQPGVA